MRRLPCRSSVGRHRRRIELIGCAPRRSRRNHAGRGPACPHRRLRHRSDPRCHQLDRLLLRLGPRGIQPTRLGTRTTRPSNQHCGFVPMGAACRHPSRAGHRDETGVAACCFRRDGSGRRHVPGHRCDVRADLSWPGPWRVRDGKRNAPARRRKPCGAPPTRPYRHCAAGRRC